MSRRLGSRAVAAQRRAAGGGSGVVLVFGLFAVGGAVMTYFLLVRPVLQVWAARDWPAVRCEVVASEVRSHRGSKGETTYSVHIRYRYSFGGSVLESDRYDFLGGSSSGRAGKVAIVNRYPPGSVAICYVNPRDPAEAVLERGFTPLMLVGLFPAVFMVIGVGGLARMFVGTNRQPAMAPDVPPWQARPDWAAGRIVSNPKGAMIIAWVIAGLWNALAWPVTILLSEELTKGNKAPALVLVFPTVGVVLLVWAAHATLRWRKFGESVLELASVPGAIGGVLAGEIRLRQPLRPETGFKLRLSCIRRYVTGSGKNRSTHESVLWQDQTETRAGSMDRVPVLFAIPADCAETNDTNPDDQILWRLQATAKLPGVDYAAEFEVPVFSIALTDEQAAVARRAEALWKQTLAQYQRPTDSPIRIRALPGGGTEFYFPPGRNAGMALAVTVVWLICTGALAALAVVGAPWPVIIGMGLFDLFLLWAALYVWFGSSRVVVDGAGITVGHGGRSSRSHRYAATEIAGVQPAIGITAGATAYHDVQIRLLDGRKITAARNIRDAREAQWLAAEMNRLLGG